MPLVISSAKIDLFNNVENVSASGQIKQFLCTTRHAVATTSAPSYPPTSSLVNCDVDSVTRCAAEWTLRGPCEIPDIVPKHFGVYTVLILLTKHLLAFAGRLQAHLIAFAPADMNFRDTTVFV